MNTLDILQNFLRKKNASPKRKTRLSKRKALWIAKQRLGGEWIITEDTRRLYTLSFAQSSLIKDVEGLYYTNNSTKHLLSVLISSNPRSEVGYFSRKRYFAGKIPRICICEITGKYFHTAWIEAEPFYRSDGTRGTCALQYCINTNAVYWWDSEHRYKDYPQPQGRRIQNYHSSTRPEWWDSAEGMGLELEFYSKNPSKLASDFSNPDILLEKDGSLDRTYGVEAVGGPYSLEQYLHKETPWEEFLEVNKTIGAKAYTAGEFYGIHVSVSRSLFTSFHVAKFVIFLNQQKELCQLIGQRKQLYGVGAFTDGYEKYKKYYELCFTNNPRTGYRNSLNDHILPRHASNANERANRNNFLLQPNLSEIRSYGKARTEINTTKYESVRVQNKRLEVRIFRSNLRRERLMKNLEFVDAVRVYTKHASAKSVATPYVGTVDFLYWLGKQSGYTNLKKFLLENSHNFVENNNNFAYVNPYKTCKNFADLVNFKLADSAKNPKNLNLVIDSSDI